MLNHNIILKLEEYIQYRTGAKTVSLIIRNMLLKPFISTSLRSFWHYWNPGYGYYLLFYCYKPIRKLLPNWVSLIITFIVCGFLHDIFYLAPMMIMNGGEFVLPFLTTWFFIISIGILMADYLKIRFDKINIIFRPIFHSGFLAITFYLTRYIDLSI